MSAILIHRAIKFSMICPAMSFLTTNTFAQCNLKKTKINGLVRIETPPIHQYIRQHDQYYAISIKTILLKEAAGKSYAVDINYTGQTPPPHPTQLSFKLENDSLVTGKLRLLKIQPIDNIKLSTKLYSFELKETDLAALKQHPLKEINIFKENGSATIPVKDPLLMQTQISCLKREL
jgi:hypothetical protein